MTNTPTTNARQSSTASAAGGKYPFRYAAQLANDIETRWQAYWEKHDTFAAPNPGDPGFDPARPKFYCLDMFPYPSGAGLHVGHPLGYIATDIICRYKRMRGFNVLHPMGFDAFGLPAEQYAIEHGVHPRVTTRRAIDTFRRQLKRFGFSYDWSRQFATIDEDYYRWTQWIWLKAYHAWYDPAEDRAQPISELIEEFESAQRPVCCNPSQPEGPVAPGRLGREFGPWNQLDLTTQQKILDTYRLAYLSVQTVNWCAKLGTVLANEEVIDGKSERGGHPVLRRPLKQWMFRITAFADRLLGDLDGLDWPESTRAMQAEWVGRSEGAMIEFPIAPAKPGHFSDQTRQSAIRVFTTRPDTLFGATYMVLAPEHPLVDQITTDQQRDAVGEYVRVAASRSDVERQVEATHKTGVFSGAYAINPATNERIPIWVADYVLMGYGTGAIMAVPAHDQRDLEFAKQFGLPIRAVVMADEEWLAAHAPSSSEPGRLGPVRAGDSPALNELQDTYLTDPVAFGEAFIGEGTNINSANDEVSLDGLPTPDAKRIITEWLQSKELGQAQVQYKLRDWLFSRQRYWGEPLPVVYDEQGNHHPVDESNLPVILPQLADYQPVESDEPTPLLSKAGDWVNATADEAGISPDVLPADAPVRRETNTMPTWAGSCWYYLRFCDPRNGERFVDPNVEQYWMGARTDQLGDQSSTGAENRAPAPGGVDLYIGGAEYAVTHLLYTRFWHKLLYDLGEVSTPEPFGRLFHQGLITSYAYQRRDTSLVPIDQVEERGAEGFFEIATGEPVTQIVAKMSKSLRNVINPDDIIAEYGTDTFRLYEMYMGPLDASKPWNTRDIVGPFRFLQRVWRLVVDEQSGDLTLRGQTDPDVERQLHQTIAKVGQDIERLAYNTAIAAMIEFINAATPAGGLTRDQLERFVLILAPFAPHITEELWSKLGHDPSLAYEPWPAYDGAMLVEDSVEMPVQIGGKVRAKLTVPADADSRQIEAIALADEKVVALLAHKTVRKVVVVPGKIVNIVAE